MGSTKPSGDPHKWVSPVQAYNYDDWLLIFKDRAISMNWLTSRSRNLTSRSPEIITGSWSTPKIILMVKFHVVRKFFSNVYAIQVNKICCIKPTSICSKKWFVQKRICPKKDLYNACATVCPTCLKPKTKV